jgi:threonine/homoserine/homoserine lactone efflux protein
MDWPTLLAFWAAFALALASPGPNFALMVRVGLGSGRPAALRTALGILLGEAVWGFAAVFGLAALALRYPVVATAIRWAGGAFLLWLAWGALRSAWRGGGGGGEGDAAPAGGGGRGGGFWTGLALMLLNAKAGFFWMSLTGVLLGTRLPAGMALLAVGVAVALSFAWHAALAIAFSDRRLHAAYRRARRGVEGVLGAVLAGLGVRLLAAG